MLDSQKIPALTGRGYEKPVIFLLLAISASAQDAGTTLADRLESATLEERAHILEQEGPTETLRAAYRSLGNRSLAYSPQGEFDKTIWANQVLLDVADTLKDPGRKASPYQAIAQAVMAQGKYTEALEIFRTGLPFAVLSGNKRTEGIFHGLIGSILRTLGEMEESKREEEQALELFQQANDQPAISRTLINLGNTAKSMGQAQVAVAYYSDALRQAQAVKSEGLEQMALLAMAELYTSQYDYTVSLSYLERIKPSTGDALAVKRQAAILDATIGNLYFRLGRAEAREVLERARAENRDVKDFQEEAWVVERLAEMDEALKPQEALQRYRDAEEIYGRVGNIVQESSALEFQARLYTRLNQPERAAEAAARALEKARKAGVPKMIGGALDELGRAYRTLGRKSEAEEAFRESIEWTEGSRMEIIGGQASGASFLTERDSPYTALTDLKAKKGDVLGAIQLAEQVRARRLLDAIAAGKVDPQQWLTADEKQREQALAHAAARRNAELSQPHPSKEAESEAKTAFEKAARDLESYRMDLYVAHAHLRARRGQAEAMTGAMIQSLVPDTKALLIEYVFWENGAWIFTVARGSEGWPVVKATRLETTQEVLRLRVEEFRKSLSTRDLTYKTLARSLYRDLLGPIEGELKGRSILGILPDGPLWNLPFQALTAGDGKYLIEQAALYYAPSLGTLYEATREKGKSGGALNELAQNGCDAIVPQLQGGARRTLCALKPLLAMGAGASDLPHAAEEVRELAALYGPSAVALSGTQATEERWKQDADGYRVLHLATHGILNSSNPLFSYLQLAKTDGEDGMLEAREILDLNLRAEVVVLSACETGRGELISGEGVFGMSWAVLTAGTRTVVVSQWKVDSASTTQLMVAFHRTIAPEAVRPGPIRSKAEALRRAAMELIRTPGYQHPFYWAGFEMLGDGY